MSSRLLRLFGGIIASSALVIGAAPAASAQIAPPPLPAEVQQVVDQMSAGSAQGVNDARNAVVGSLESLGIAPPPGLAPQPPAPADPTPESPCPRTADACVDLAGNRTWLQDGGTLSYGPVPMSHGKPGWETPPGTFKVARKVRHEISYEFGNAPMPYAVYFVGGIAFHQGDIATQSHGCVRLEEKAAAHFFDRLAVGDTVFVY